MIRTPERQTRRVRQLGAGLLLLSPLGLVAGQLAAGSNILLVLLAIATLFLGFIPLIRRGQFDFGAVLTGLVVVRFVGGPLVAKAVLDQPLESNLEHPTAAFLAVFIGVISYAVAASVAKATKVGRPWLPAVVQPTQLKALSIGAALIGITGNALVLSTSLRSASALHIGNFFAPFLLLALTCAIAQALVQSRGVRMWNVYVLVLVVAQLGFALARNARVELIGLVLAIILPSASFRGRFQTRQVLVFGASLLTLSLLVTPVFLSVRQLGPGLNWSQRITATIQGAASVIAHGDNAAAIASYRSSRAAKERTNYYLNYYGAPHNVLERLSLVNHVDLILSGADRHGQLGWSDLSFALQQALPRFLAPGKAISYGQGDWVYCQVGVRCLLGAFSTAPLIADGYAAFGWVGVATYALVFPLLLLILLKKVAGEDMRNNVWVVFFLILMNNGYVEGTSGRFLVSILRTIPQDIATIIVLLAISRLFRRATAN